MYKMISVDNPTSVGNDFVGSKAEFNFNGSQFFFGLLYSSRVKFIDITDNIMTIQTKNTKYIFEKVVE